MSTTRNLVAAVGYGPGWLIAQAKPINSFYSCVSRHVFISTIETSVQSFTKSNRDCARNR